GQQGPALCVLSVVDRPVPVLHRGLGDQRWSVAAPGSLCRDQVLLVRPSRWSTSMSTPTTPTTRWYPSHAQLKDPQSTERAFREALRMFNDLHDSHTALQVQVKQNGQAPAQQPTNTASVTRLLGLPVIPSDTTQLADGTVLTYKAAQRAFVFQ